MRLLLDTHTLIWHQTDNKRLSVKADRMIADPGNRVFVSMATLWEMAIKRSRGKLEIKESPMEYLEIYLTRGVELLNISPDHIMAIESLPWRHADPFDRMLIAQAQTEDLTILTVDKIFTHYDVKTAW